MIKGLFQRSVEFKIFSAGYIINFVAAIVLSSYGQHGASLTAAFLACLSICALYWLLKHKYSKCVMMTYSHDSGLSRVSFYSSRDEMISASEVSIAQSKDGIECIVLLQFLIRVADQKIIDGVGYITFARQSFLAEQDIGVSSVSFRATIKDAAEKFIQTGATTSFVMEGIDRDSIPNDRMGRPSF